MINVKFIRSIVEQVTELDLSNGNRKRDYSDARAIYYKIYLWFCLYIKNL